MSRTVVNLNDRLLQQARKLTGLKKKVDVVNLALAELVRVKEAGKMLALAGRARWEGNLRALRRDRGFGIN